MKNGKRLLILLVTLLVAPFVAVDAGAGKWQKYDDFNKSGQINTDKWDIEDDNGTIEIENGRVKFVRVTGNPKGRHRIVFNDCIESIVGIKATIEAAPDCKSTDNEIAALVYPGEYDGYYSEIYAYIKPNRNWISGSMYVLGKDWNWLHDLFWSELTSGTDVVAGGPFTLSTVFDAKKNQVTFEVEGHGKVVYDIPESMEPRTHYWARIGAWTNGGQGPCTFYVDDVYVMRNGKCDKKAPKVKKTLPKKNKKKISRDTDWLEITFNEPMQQRHSVDTSGIWPVSGTTPAEWVNATTFRISRDNAGTPLPPDSTIEITLNPQGHGLEFRDIKGFPLKTYTFKFKTGK